MYNCKNGIIRLAAQQTIKIKYRYYLTNKKTNLFFYLVKKLKLKFENYINYK